MLPTEQQPCTEMVSASLKVEIGGFYHSQTLNWCLPETDLHRTTYQPFCAGARPKDACYPWDAHTKHCVGTLVPGERLQREQAWGWYAHHIHWPNQQRQEIRRENKRIQGYQTGKRTDVSFRKGWVIVLTPAHHYLWCCLFPTASLHHKPTGMTSSY